MSKLVIVESPSKARTISRFLGRGYRVKASQGHLIDLPKSQLGIEIENGFAPHYITIRGKGDILKELKEAGKSAERIYLAADPDREGEAICWHLSQALNIPADEPCRVEFNEITQAAVKEAFNRPRPIDPYRVDAQQARRILDRLVGYQISPLLWRKIRSGLSAGRVQSVAVRLICDREAEIEAFQSSEYWTLEALLQAEGSTTPFKAALSAFRGKKIELADESQAKEAAAAVQNEPFIVRQVRKLQRRRRPAPPFTTSSLQQEASSRLGFTGHKTMSLAQQLYEGIKLDKGEVVGLVTYIRTDAVRISQQARQDARAFIESRFGKDFVPEREPVYKARKGAQEAHEAIRPTSVYRDPETVKPFLGRDQFRLYKLIWDRFLASQMAPALYDQVQVKISAGEYLFRATGSTLRFPGYLAVYGDPAQGREEEKMLPPLEESQRLTLLELLPEQHFTQPPARYSESTLIKTLEEQGIGRPSTYAPIIQTIQAREYVYKENKVFRPTELGKVIVELLKEFFPEIIDVSFTAQMELQLDQIEEGKLQRLEVLDNFYQTFRVRLAKADQEMAKVELQPEESEETCPQCGRNLVYRRGRFGRFLACPGYPDCRFTKKIQRETGVACPLCGNVLVERRTRKGKVFYGCSDFPRCRFSVWDKPLAEKCPRCGELLVQSGSRKKAVKRCSNKECSFSEPILVEAIREG